MFIYLNLVSKYLLFLSLLWIILLMWHFWLIASFITNILDDVFLGYVILDSENALSTMPLWYIVAFIAWIILLLSKKYLFKDLIVKIIKNKYDLIGFLACNLFGVIFWFLTINELWVWGNAIISNLQIVLILAYSYFVFWEKITKSNFIAWSLMLFWMLLFANWWYENSLLWFVYWFISMIFWAFRSIWNKKIWYTDLPSELVVTLRSLFILVILSLWLVLFKIEFYSPSNNIAFLILWLWALSWPILNKYSTIKALKYFKLSFFTLISLVVPVFIFVAWIVFYQEPINLYNCVGWLLILLWALFLKK